jgi:NADPH-dependent glutamate synthase beta subunit-like oxidoreductase/ferredoxin
MIEHITAGDAAEAIRAARERILFNAVLGRICPAFCERVCRRAQLDESVSIAALQRFAGDAGIGAESAGAAEKPAVTGKKIAIVGAGPAGLTAAFYLLRRGHACVLFDANKLPGGMWRYGVGEFRLPRTVLDGEIDVVRRLGGEFRMETRLEGASSLDALRRDYDAVLLATGAPVPVALDCEGAEFAEAAMCLLGRVGAGERSCVGSSVVVIGSGDMALDAARTAVRLGAANVTLLSPKERKAIHPVGERVETAETEGVEVRAGVRVTGIEAALGAGFRLTAEEGGKSVRIEASAVYGAADRAADVGLFAGMGLAVTKKGIAADAHAFTTNIGGVFAAGECVLGPDYGVRAVAAGRQAATAIDQFLSGLKPAGETRPINVHMGVLNEEELAIVRSTADPSRRAPDESIAPEARRQSFDEVERGLSMEAATAESRRCVRCSCLAKDYCELRRHATEYGANPGRFKGSHRRYGQEVSHRRIVYEPNKCILCGRCIRAAAEGNERVGLSFLGRGFATTVGVPFERELSEGLAVAGHACVTVCPTGALAFKRGTGPEPERGTSG